ncbi:MAG: ABC transporter substrate-binding protein [Deltaproteobacteria bacterium]|nr:ABC transporter substrate-binding protein [Deltaproteobacteria bacterium]MBW2611672.1 ABC transporter substrate-binding protein [Deltaproteobacteria bacterium]MBW2632968.1 ABC transporter substrate-binding protein [Deltaproteobacteria bacterium]
MKNKQITIMLVALSFLLILGFSTQVLAGETYKMGMSVDITGATSDIGNPYSKGAEDYVKYVNDEKLLGNDKLVLFIRDDAYKTETTKRNFEDFLDEDIVLYQNYSTGSTLALRQDFDEEKIPTITASFHAGNLENCNYLFLPIASYSSQAVGLAEYVVANHKGSNKIKVAMFLHPSAFGRGPLGDVKKAIDIGLPIELVEVVEHGKDLDNTAMLKRFQSKGVQYVISQTVQPPVATMLKGAQSLGMAASTYGEAGKITFLGCHYAGGPDLIGLAGSAAEGFYWTTSYKLMTAKGPGTDAQLALAKRYGRDDKLANSQNYTNGIMVIQVAVEAIRRVKAKSIKVNRANLFEELQAMNGYNAFYPLTTVGPVSFSKTDREGVDTLQLYVAKGGVFHELGAPFVSEYVQKLKK